MTGDCAVDSFFGIMMASREVVMAEENTEEIEVPVRDNDEGAEIRDTDIVFDCPHCGKNLFS